MAILLWRNHKPVVQFVTLVLFVTIYLCFGALIFQKIEGPKEEELRLKLNHDKKELIARATCLKEYDEDLEKFILAVITANNRGVSAVRNVTSQPNWSFGQAFFFAGTVLTTIGYGRVTPLSEGGKIFCIFFALIGIPVTLLLFGACVERLAKITDKLLELLRHMGSTWSDFRLRFVQLAVVGLMLLVVMFLIPAVVFMCLEPEWDYLDSFYYCFISLTTIGLVYLFCGLICMLLMLHVVNSIPQLNFGAHFQPSMVDDGECTPLTADKNAAAKYMPQTNETSLEDAAAKSSLPK